MYTIGLDLGGTKINAGLIKNRRVIIKSQKIPTPARRGRRAILNTVIDSIKEVKGKQKIKAIGMSVAGQVNDKGVLTQAPNFPRSFQNIPLQKIIQREFSVPTFIDNDANCFTLAEAILGEAKKHSHVVGLTLGTGIGGGIVINKKIYHGATNTIEIGHMIIRPENKTRCGCGQTGHLESLTSGLAMVKLYNKLTGKTGNTFIIVEEAGQGKKLAKKVIQEMAENLGIGLANITHIINPGIIVLGGGLARVRILVDPAINMTKKRLSFKSLQGTKIAKSKLGDDASILGAGLLLGGNR